MKDATTPVGTGGSDDDVGGASDTDMLDLPAGADGLAGPTASEFRDAMACVGAAVHVVTTDGPGGLAGFTASAVCSVSDTPPTLLVCLNRSSSAFPAVERNGVVAINTLSGGDEDLARLFGGKVPMPERFARAPWRPGRTGAPLIAGAAAFFEGRVSSVVSVGTHDVLFCDVVAVGRGGATAGLLYSGRRYHAVPL